MCLEQMKIMYDFIQEEGIDNANLVPEDEDEKAPSGDAGEFFRGID